MKNLFNGIDPDDIVKGVLALIFFATGLAFTFILGRVSVLSCNRVEDADRCGLAVTWLGLSTLRETRIEGLRGAQIEESCDDGDCRYRVSLVTAPQTLPLHSDYVPNKGGQQALADEINAFTKDRAMRTLKVSAGGGLWLILPCIFLALGIYMAMKPLTNAIQKIFGRN